MGVLIAIASGLFIFLCILLIIVILLQSDKSAGMGILGGSSQSAFGSSTADVITKITSVMVALFLLGSLGLAALESQRTISIEKKILDTGDETTDEVDINNIGNKTADKETGPGVDEGAKDTNILNKKLK